MLTIGHLAKMTEVKIPTIRYYESIGLLTLATRTAGNQRIYSEADRERLDFIRHARGLGFSIDTIRQLLSLAQHPERPCRDADQIAVTQLAAVRKQIRSLTRMEKELARIATSCQSGTADGCYVLEALSNHTLCDTEHR